MRLFTILTTCALLVGALAAEEQVVFAGIRVCGPAHGDPDDMQKLQAFSQSEGTAVALLILRKEGGIIEVDDDECTLKTAVDSKNKDLTRPRPKTGRFSFNNKARFGPFPKVAKDGTAALVEVDLPQRPSPGATEVGIIGTVQITVGGEPKTAKCAGVAYKTAGTTFKVGPLTFEVDEFEDEAWGDWKCGLDLKTTDDYATVKEITFFAGGKEIESHCNGGGSGTINGKTTTTKCFQLKAIPEKLDVAITYYSKVAKIDVPIKVKAGLDLGLTK